MDPEQPLLGWKAASVIPLSPHGPPGGGFDLIPTYGTATIRLFPDTTIHISPIPGSTEYNNTMHKLSLESSKHTAPPYNWW
ncbi:hypothetical protein H2201_003962 [Coniosporium apollinis]|uniref:Uncharacterized protein n=1 Tax=Coniosporium apollinis TaxID=61459 RepID=A0ABQ9NVT0_9PEZI|nr:hypothetical protein H2201_003962 [Coniosporium apollinis]